MKKIRIKKLIKNIFNPDTAYREGYIHFYCGNFPSARDNPYKKDSQNFKDWQKGFFKSVDDAMLKIKNATKKIKKN